MHLTGHDMTDKNLLKKLLDSSIITPDQAKIAEQEIKLSGHSKKISDVLVELGFVSQLSISELFSSKNLEMLTLSSMKLKQDVVRKLPKDFATQNKVILVEESENEIKVAMENVNNILVLDKLKILFSGRKIVPVYARETDIAHAIDKYYEYSLKISEIIDEIENGPGLSQDDINDSEAYQSPVARLVEAILIDAVHKGASDIHIEPEEYFVRVRYRIDGVLINQLSFHKKYWESVVVRIKVISSLNIAESRRPQDGSLDMNVSNRKVDFRVSITSTVFGENIVLRVLDRDGGVLTLEQLGFSKRNMKLVNISIEKPEGIMIITGPTGSGKTTTLYSVLSMINSPEVNIMTLEDPVEYSVPMIRQTSINIKAGIDFASGLRALMRQDPDVILVGEIRDTETAITAMRAAMTGHQVFSTLHTNDAISAIDRLLDIGVQSHIIANSLNAIIAQRLVRKLCVKCKKKRKITEEEYTKLRLKKDKFKIVYDSVGCSECNMTGFKGRTIISEMVVLSDKIRDMISNKATQYNLTSAIKEEGFVTMQKNGLLKVLQGHTSFHELRTSVDMTNYFY